MRLRHWIGVFLICGPQLAHGNAWNQLFKVANLGTSDIRIAERDLKLMNGTSHQLPFFQALQSEPLALPFYARTMREMILGYSQKPYDLTLFAAQRTQTAVRRALIGHPLQAHLKTAASVGGVVAALSAIYRAKGSELPKVTALKVQADSERLPTELRTAIAEILYAQAQAYAWHKKAFSKVASADLKWAMSERLKAPSRSAEDQMEGLNPTLRRLIDTVDFKAINAGGADLIYTIQNTHKSLTAVELKPGGDFSWSTPLGEVIIRTSQKNHTQQGRNDILLLIDLFGDDTYFKGGAATSLQNPISVLWDFSGNDKYVAQNALINSKIGAQPERLKRIEPTFGSGFFGIGILVDGNGDDLYRAYRQSMGRGDFGFGVAWDLGGNDTYDCWTQCQGSAEFGTAALIDEGGKDLYSGFQQIQGYAGPLGSGLLVDFGNDADTFEANNSQIDFPSSVDPKHNTSLAQGMAQGIRADFSDGHSIAGGFGGLIDGGGDNQFSAGFYAQGSSYWYAVGFLSSGQGNDQYQASKYGQAAAVHFAVALLHDAGGNDSYKVEQELGIGHGHDFGVSFFIDDSGDDRYEAANLSLGCATAQGLGIFWDRKGNDSYIAKHPETLGCAALRVDTPSPRILGRTLGLFLDTDGENSFDSENLKGKKRSHQWLKKSQARLLGAGLITQQSDTQDPIRVDER